MDTPHDTLTLPCLTRRRAIADDAATTAPALRRRSGPCGPEQPPPARGLARRGIGDADQPAGRPPAALPRPRPRDHLDFYQRRTEPGGHLGLQARPGPVRRHATARLR